MYIGDITERFAEMGDEDIELFVKSLSELDYGRLRRIVYGKRFKKSKL